MLLMLLCPRCHKLIDRHKSRYTVETLRGFKRVHEDRVFMLTDTKPDRDTVAVVLRGQIAGRPVSVTLPEIQDAVAPRYLGKRDVHEIDLTTIKDTASSGYWSVAAETVRTRMSRFYETFFGSGPPRHVSVFALAPIPLLMVLGTCLSDKVPTALYQRHRDTEDWKWKRTGRPIEFRTRVLRRGSQPGRVALLAALSGRISEQDLPHEIDGRFTVYELAPRAGTPNPSLLKVAASLEAFRTEYRRALRLIADENPGTKVLQLFPAVPAPAAVALGRDLLPKRDPVLVVYDFNKNLGGFAKTVEINQP